MGLLAIIVWTVAVGVVGGLSLLFYQGWKHKQFFKKRGIPFLGAGYSRMFRVLTGQDTMLSSEKELYDDAMASKSPIAGYSDFLSLPGVLVTDIELTRNIYVKDFDYFMNRRTFATQKGDKFFRRMLVMVEKDQWKGMRSRLSPTFTTGKIRRMFSIFEKSSNRMCDYLRNVVGPDGADQDICQIYSKYSMDTIANCAFGIDSKSFDTEIGKMSTFEEMGQQFQFRFKPLLMLKFMLVQTAPKIAEMLGVSVAENRPQEYFEKVCREVMKLRKESGTRQEDFLQLMMDVKEGCLKNEEDSKENGEGKNELGEDIPKFNFEDDDIIANCMLFLIAGYDTLQSLLIFAAYALALEPEVQQKLLEEINTTMEENGGKLTYDSIHNMTYLDMVVNETLRFYSPAVRTERVCTKDYKVPGTDMVIEKGVLVNIPVMGTHRNPEHYANPNKFDPDHFLPEVKNKRHPYAFVPFGMGPRNCIGMRFALTEAKAVIATLVHHFKLEPCSKTEIPMTYSNASTLKPANGAWLRVTPRENEE